MSVKDHNIVNDISLWFPMNVTDNNVITCYYTATDYGKTVHSARGVLTFFGSVHLVVVTTEVR